MNDVALEKIMIVNTNFCISVNWHGQTIFENACAEANPYLSEIDTWYINRVLVKEHLRGKGIGSQILQILLKEIKKHNAKKAIVTPGGYGSDSKQQFNFYLKNGFQHSKKDNFTLIHLLQDIQTKD